MKLHSLEIEGFGPFLERQIIDFDAFDDDGIFLIAGRTGAGKSSILDGVGFALYGAVPRYEGGAKRLRSDHCRPEDRSEVRLEFTVGDRRWRVTRSPEYERPKRNGTGLTIEEHRAIVEELVDAQWVGRAAKPREAGELLGEILGLNREQFQQVILLAQNRFAQFLLARNDDRQALLRTLFGSRTYQEYEQALDARRKDAEAAVADRLRAVESVLDEAERIVMSQQIGGDDAPATGVPDRLDALERAIERGRYRVETCTTAREAAVAARDAAFTAHENLKQLHEQHRARDAARAVLAELEARATSVEADQVTLHAARRAEALRATLERAERAEAAVAAARVAEEAARAGWEHAGGQSGAGRLDTVIDELTGQIAVWREARGHESALAALSEQQTVAQRDAEAADTRITALEQQRAEVPVRRVALDTALREHEAVAATVEDARALVAQAQQRLGAARDVVARGNVCDAAEKHKLLQQERATAAAAAADALLRRRVQERAGELAGALIDDEPCPVCGSRSHPHPAPRGDAPVTDDEIAAAEAERDAAQGRARIAGDEYTDAKAAYADAIARAGGLDIDAAQHAYDDAAQRLSTAEDAVRTRDARRAERDALDDEEARIACQLDTARATLTAARHELATLGERVAAAAKAVEQARGEFATVAARIADAEHRRAAAIALHDALSARTSAEEAARSAAEDCQERVAASDFTDPNVARAALRDDAERARLEKSIGAYEKAVSEQKGQLVQLELQLAGVDDPLPELEASALLLADAREAAEAASQASAGAAHTVAGLVDLTERARAAHAQIAELEASHRLVAGVADAVAGRNERKMDLETFVLAAELERIVAAANLRLDAMSAGRYRLAHTDALAARNAASGLGLEIVDAYTGQARPAQSLSGGETFLASLALALGLAQVVTDRAGGIRLDTLFIDEGFGSLDPETLELAMRTLDELREGGRTVGVISHVEAMKEQIPAQLVVEAAAHGPSAVRQNALDPA